MGHWKTLTLEAHTEFRPGAGESWSGQKAFQYRDIKVGNQYEFDNFYVSITDMSEDTLKCDVKWSYASLSLDGGSFELNATCKKCCTPSLNVAYDTHCGLCLILDFEENPYERMKIIVDNLQDGAEVLPPATDEEISKCNTELAKYKLPLLPDEYVKFLKICTALEFNGMAIFGSYGCQIVEQNMMFRQFHSYHRNKDALLIFGRIDDDVYTYNATTNKYEARDINGFDIWDEYDSFESFFFKEMMKWLR